MSSDKEILALEDERYAAMFSGDFAALEASAISREPERLRDAQDAINVRSSASSRASPPSSASSSPRTLRNGPRW